MIGGEEYGDWTEFETAIVDLAINLPRIRGLSPYTSPSIFSLHSFVAIIWGQAPDSLWDYCNSDPQTI
jgi:hypothetical protein